MIGFKKFKFLKLDYSRLNLFSMVCRLKFVSMYCLREILICSGISFFLPLRFVYFSVLTIRCLNYNGLSVLDKMLFYKQVYKNYSKLIEVRRNLRFFLVKNSLPCNGQRTKTNAKTCKRKNSVRLSQKRRFK